RTVVKSERIAATRVEHAGKVEVRALEVRRGPAARYGDQVFAAEPQGQLRCAERKAEPAAGVPVVMEVGDAAAEGRVGARREVAQGVALHRFVEAALGADHQAAEPEESDELLLDTDVEADDAVFDCRVGLDEAAGDVVLNGAPLPPGVDADVEAGPIIDR